MRSHQQFNVSMSIIGTRIIIVPNLHLQHQHFCDYASDEMKKGENFEVTVVFRSSFSVAGHRVIIGGTSCNLPASALSYEGAIS